MLHVNVENMHNELEKLEYTAAWKEILPRKEQV